MATQAADALAPVMPGVDLSPTSWRQGLPCYTPDRQFITGQVPGVDGLFLSAGCNESFVTHGPGLGRALAQTVLTGGSDFADLSDYRLDRFDLRGAVELELAASPW
jgi:glycine/D-amino acid oxidase-like deaminating enzyme